MEEVVKKKRGRPRKKDIMQVLPDNVQEIIQEVEEKEIKEIRHEIELIRQEKKGDWDVPIGDSIEYFDSNLSYELTGYRPIDEKNGLDFDPTWFTETRRTYERTGMYCKYDPKSKAYADFWTEQYMRCRDGMTVNGYTITGDNYFFLNFYRLMDLGNTEKAGSGRIEIFPNFYVKQYEYFHYIELCRRLRKNAIGLKARGVGFSEIGASIAVNTYNCRRSSITVITAQQEIYVSKTLEKCWTQLNFLNDNTNGGFYKLRQVVDTAMTKKASVYKIVNGQKVESGFKSIINGIAADKPNKIRGDRVDLLIYEESGSWPDWKRAFEQGDALVGIQGQKFGIKMAWGTGGDKGHALAGLRDAYKNPQVYDALPYRHNYTRTGDSVISAYFIPAYTILTDADDGKCYYDHRGWTNPIEAKKYYEKKRDIKASDPEALIIHCAEYCFVPEEALSLEGVNKFDKVKIADQIARIRLTDEAPEIEDGSLTYRYKKGAAQTKGNITGLKWEKNKGGKIHILEHPIWTYEGSEDNPRVGRMSNMYVAGIDSIDQGGKDTSAATKDPSDFCIVIKKRTYGIGEPMYVAYYKDRPRDVREAYQIAIRLLEYYNCKCVLEKSRTSIVTWARDNGYINLFMYRTRATLTDKQGGFSREIGVPATTEIIDHQTDLIADYVSDYYRNIWFDDMLDELNRYTDENKGQFDIIAAMGMAELGDEELNGVIPRDVDNIKNSFQDFGYYTDQYGYKRYGVIPKQDQKAPIYSMQTNDNNWIRTSDPRRL